MINKKVLEFYKKTSMFTDLGLYKDFALNLPNDIEKLCLLQRNQIIHPFDLEDEEIINDPNSFYGDMTKVDKTSLKYENDLFPTAQSIIAELVRRDNSYSTTRNIKNKIHVCCREQAILLASILKAKGYAARVRSGFAQYCTLVKNKSTDHWITEYYDNKTKRWILVDADMYFDNQILQEYHIDFNLLDVPRNKFIFGAEAYLGLRKKVYKETEIFYASNPIQYGIKAALHGLFYEFHSLMNNEIIFLHLPKYIKEKNFILSEEEYKELDILANLMLDPDSNFYKLQKIWHTNEKFRILKGGMN